MNRSSGLRIALCPARRGSQLKTVAAGIPASLMMLLGMAVTFCTWFPFLGIAWWQAALGMSALTAVLCLLRLTGHSRTVLTGLLILVVVVCCMAHKQIIGGLGCLGNKILDRLTQVTGRIYLDFSAPESASPFWCIAPLAAVYVVLLQLSVQTGRISFLLPMLLGMYIAVILGLFPVDAGMILLGIGTILLLMQGEAAKSDTQSWWGVPTWLLVPVICLLVAAGIGCGFGNSNSHTSRWKQALHTMLYDQDTNSMPEGDLKNLPGWNKSDTKALKLTMTQPQKLYLRGVVYETYDGTSWTQRSARELSEEESLFYWLHRSGFFGQSQIGTAWGLTTQEAPAELTIENLSACKAHGYFPYALCGSENLDAALIGDNSFPESESLGYYPGSVPAWYETQQLLASAQGQQDISAYLDQEKAYEAYVTDVDLQLTNESWSVLNRQFEGEAVPQTLSQILNFIRTWLAENLVYDEQVKTLNGNSDFLQYTLERSGSGYSVHYATAATLMLRYFGVPARYVEGYFLSAAEAEYFQPGQTILLTENHAHAWAEYYLPGVGFIPFEVTPGYVDGEELELGGSLLQNEQIYSGDHLKYAQVEQPEKIEEPQQDRFSFTLKPVYLLYLAMILLTVLAAVIFVKRKRFQKALLAIEKASNREAIAMRFGYAVRLRDTCGNLTLDGTSRAEGLNREALFSNHRMTNAQRQEMDAYAQQVLEACKNTWSIPQKLRYRLWDCLY